MRSRDVPIKMYDQSLSSLEQMGYLVLQDSPLSSREGENALSVNLLEILDEQI